MRFRSGQGGISAYTTGQFFSARFARRLFVALGLLLNLWHGNWNFRTRELSSPGTFVPQHWLLGVYCKQSLMRFKKLQLCCRRRCYHSCLSLVRPSVWPSVMDVGLLWISVGS